MLLFITAYSVDSIKAKIPNMQYANVACLSFSKFVKEHLKVPGYSIAFVFAIVPIGLWSDPLAAFTFTSVYASGHVCGSTTVLEMLFRFLLHSYSHTA